MKQLYKYLHTLCCLAGLLAATTHESNAQQYPTIDGQITYIGDRLTATSNEYGSQNQNWAASGSNTRWHMTFNEQYLYIGVEGANASAPARLYFNTSPNGGISSGVEGIAVPLPFAAEVAISLGTTPNGSSIQYARTTPGGATWETLNIPSDQAMSADGTVREIRIAWANFYPQGKPASFEWLAYLATSPISGAVPTTNAAGSALAYYYNVYTGNTNPTFERLSYTASSAATTAPGGTFFNYAVNNGQKQVTLSGDLTVNGRLYVRNTTIVTGNNTVTLDQYATLDEEENNQVNRNANGYISGKVAMRATLDKDSTYRAGNMGLMLVVKAASGGATYPGSTLITRLTGQTYTGGTGKTTVSRFFFLNPSKVASSNLDVEMTMHYAQEEINSIPEGRLSFFKSKLPATITLAGAGFVEEGRDRTGLNAGNNTIRLSGVELNGIWTLAAQGVPLPVELTQFTAQAETNAVRLRWATASELNNKGFEVQRQLPAGTWQTLTFINGQGTSDRSSSYEYLDRTAGTGIQYYRLVQTDLDGKITYSAVVTVAVGTQAAGLFTLYPSPATTSLSLSGLQNGKHSVAIYNTQGQRVASHELSEAQTTVAIDHLPAGIYTLRVVGTGRASASARFVKE